MKCKICGKDPADKTNVMLNRCQECQNTVEIRILKDDFNELKEEFDKVNEFLRKRFDFGKRWDENDNT